MPGLSEIGRAIPYPLLSHHILSYTPPLYIAFYTANLIGLSYIKYPLLVYPF